MQFPIQTGNDTAQADALNYLLSGPSGLGQDFQGYQQWTTGWLTSNFRTPYTVLSYDTVCTGVSGELTIVANASFDTNALVAGMTVSGYGVASGAVIVSIGTPTTEGTTITLDLANTDDIDNDLQFTPAIIPQIYVAPIPLGTSTLLDPYTWKFEFAAPEAAPPFVRGNNIFVAGVTSAYDPANSFSKSGTKAALGSDTTYTNIVPTTTTGSGSGLVLDIKLLASGATTYSGSNTITTVVQGGTGYVVGDTLTVSGSSIGGTTPTNNLTLTVTAITSIYDGDYSPIGVTECTTTYVIAKTSAAYSVLGPGSGGTVTLYQTSDAPTVYALSTDCNSKITVAGGTDRVFIAAQLINSIKYTATTPTDLNYGVAINRYRGFPNDNPVNPGFFFQPDKLIAKKVYQYSGLVGVDQTLPEVETIFSNFPDTDIAPGYYWYILDVSFQRTNGGDLEVTQSTLGLRSMSTQVVKQ
jgi:hypothetical protein